MTNPDSQNNLRHDLRLDSSQRKESGPTMNPKTHILIGTCLTAFCVLTSCSGSKAQWIPSSLAKALADNNLEGVRAAVADGRKMLGERAGEPEEADEFRKTPIDAKIFVHEEAQCGFTMHFATFEKMRWWKTGVDPTTLTAPLRGPASVIVGNMAAVRAKLDDAECSLAMAKEAAEFLIWAQEQAGSGVYPFPTARGTSKARAMEVATRFIANAEKAGKLETVVRNGWAFDDAGDGGLQFDNGECGAALLDLYEVTMEHRYLESARKSADWAAGRPLCPNWNYNSFSVFLLAKTFAVTRDPKYLDVAILKARLGVIPGQLTDGPRAGRWVDPHNARPAYHYIMMRALAQLVAVIPLDHVARPEIMSALSSGLKTRNADMVARGVMNKDSAMECLLLVEQVFKNDGAFLRDTQSGAALDAICRLVSDEARRGKQPLGPRAWGLFLQSIASNPAIRP
jgi:hypothetical protein